jgi:hypothetical protein
MFVHGWRLAGKPGSLDGNTGHASQVREKARQNHQVGR